MASDRTEKPTQRRLDKARQEGNFLSSRELVSAMQFAVFFAALSWVGPECLTRMRELLKAALLEAFQASFGPAELYHFVRDVALKFSLWLAPVFAGVTAVPLLLHLALTGGGLAPSRFKLDIARLNPAGRLKDLPGQNLAACLQALLLLPLLLYAVYAIVRPDWQRFLGLPRLAPGGAFHVILDSARTLLWKALGLFVLLGALDFGRQWRRYFSRLRMTKQEIREELKESEGNPLVKMQIRRLQRDMARRQMLKAVPKATAVITNPTHYAVAIRYEVELMAAPVVVAKGRNYLARRIREIAAEHNITIVENPPLAQALYKSAEVGQEIPVELYRAVAEVLAYIYRLLRPDSPEGKGQARR